VHAGRQREGWPPRDLIPDGGYLDDEVKYLERHGYIWQGDRTLLPGG
jgi:hypothetical protein